MVGKFPTYPFLHVLNHAIFFLFTYMGWNVWQWNGGIVFPNTYTFAVHSRSLFVVVSKSWLVWNPFIIVEVRTITFYFEKRLGSLSWTFLFAAYTSLNTTWSTYFNTTNYALVICAHQHATALDFNFCCCKPCIFLGHHQYLLQLS